MRYVVGFVIALVVFVLFAWAQSPTGSSTAFGFGTASCQGPLAGQTILCGTSSGFQASANGAPYTSLGGGVLNYQNAALSAVPSNNTMDVPLYTYNLPGSSTIGSGQGVMINACFKLSGSVGSNFKLKFGATSLTLFPSGVSNTTLSCFAASIINNPGVTNAQQMILLYGAAPGSIPYSSVLATPAENTSGATAITIQLTANCVSTCSTSWTPESWLVTKIQ